MGNTQGRPIVFTDEGEPFIHLQLFSGLNISSAPKTCLHVSSLLSCRPIVLTFHHPTVHLDHFKLLRVVGKGAFGKVRIVERKDTGLTFALKYIRKDEGLFHPPPCTVTQNPQAYTASVVRSENVRNIIRERRMLEHLSHPFLCNLRYSFQDFEYL